jgi:hypothetical protein
MWADGNACAIGPMGDQFLSKFKVGDYVRFIGAQFLERKDSTAIPDRTVAYGKRQRFIWLQRERFASRHSRIILWNLVRKWAAL